MSRLRGFWARWKARVAAHRMRKRFRELFRQTIAETVYAAGDVDAEMRHLIAIFERGVVAAAL